MEISRMSMGIIKIIDELYGDIVNNECIDINQIKDICNLYKNKSKINTSVSLTDIEFSSPYFTKMTTKVNKKNQVDILKSDEFGKKYAFFVRIMYSCLKMNIEIFDNKNNVITLKNNYQMIKSLENKKKNLIMDHLSVLKSQYKNVTHRIGQEYESYYEDYITKIKIVDKIIVYINKLIYAAVFEKTDNLLSLILPYFYTYTEYIEEYN